MNPINTNVAHYNISAASAAAPATQQSAVSHTSAVAQQQLPKPAPQQASYSYTDSFNVTVRDLSDEEFEAELAQAL